MDFGSLLHQAQRNERNAKKEPSNYYRTSFDPPKKEAKSAKTLSANIQKFLARKEEEERKKETEAKKKRDELLALRSQDGKAKKRVAAMLKRTKAANKSAIADAVDDDNTAVTIGGPAQCDEDDYGYVSQEASAFYAKLMDKYQSAPPEEPLFPQEKKSVVHDLKSTKDRVKMALLREEEEEMMPKKRKRKHKDKTDDPDDQNVTYSGSDMRDLVSEDRFEEKKEKKAPKLKKMAPPPMDFNELLKIAQQKQYEPVSKSEPKAVVDEPERPMTKKQREEYLKELEYRKRKEERDLARQNALKDRSRNRDDRQTNEISRDDRTPNKIQRLSESEGLGRIPKVGDSRDDRPAGFNRIPKLSDKYGKDSPQQRIPKVADKTYDRNDERNQLSQMRIPKASNSNSQERVQSQQKLPKQSNLNRSERPSLEFDDKRIKLNGVREEQSRNKIVKDDDRRPNRPDDQRKLMKGSDEYSNRTGSGGREEQIRQRISKDNCETQGSRQYQVNKDVEQKSRGDDIKFKKCKTEEIRTPKMNGNSLNTSGNLSKPPIGTKTVKDRIDDRGRSSYPALDRKEVNGIVRSKLDDQRKLTVNGNRPPDFSKKLQESLQNKFQQRKEEMMNSSRNSKPDNSERTQPTGIARDMKTSVRPSDNIVRGVKPSQNPQSRDLDRREGVSKSSLTNVNRAAQHSSQQERKVMGAPQSRPSITASKDNRPVPGAREDNRPRQISASDSRPKQAPPANVNGRKLPPQAEAKPRQFPPPDVGRPRQFPPPDVGRPRQFPPPDVGRPKQFPPPDVKRARQFPPPDVRKKQKPPATKRRILDSEDEYDSELDDFIDDGPDDAEDYSKHIKEIFGYDKSRYSNVEDDDECMESNFGQVLREEFVSTKMGILEDLEDIKMEQEEKRRKAMMKKKKLK